MEIDINATMEKYKTAKEDNKLNVSRAKVGLANNPIRETLKKIIQAYKDADKDFVCFDIVEIADKLNHGSDIAHIKDKYLRAIESIIVENKSAEDFKKMSGFYHPENTAILRKYVPNRVGWGIDYNKTDNLLFVTLKMDEFGFNAETETATEE